jgi:ankyrin repeat protein
LEYGAVVTKAAQNGWTPLHFAGHAGAIDAAALLLRAGASKDARTIGDTLRPADCAVEKKHPDCAEVIRLYREPPVQVKEVFDMMDAAAASSRASTASDLLNTLAGESLASMASAQTMLGLS